MLNVSIAQKNALKPLCPYSINLNLSLFELGVSFSFALCDQCSYKSKCKVLKLSIGGGKDVYKSSQG